MKFNHFFHLISVSRVILYEINKFSTITEKQHSCPAKLAQLCCFLLSDKSLRFDLSAELFQDGNGFFEQVHRDVQSGEKADAVFGSECQDAFLDSGSDDL